jgi:hypothetical protein
MVGNPGLDRQQEDDVVLATLTDGYTTPNPVAP